MEYKNRVLGILGGLGPMSSAYFYELITEHTKAKKDQDHINLILSSKATTPDRTSYILNNDCENPLSAMMRQADMLAKAGASIIAMPCNTAHFFYDALCKSCPVPILNIIWLTVSYASFLKAGSIGLLATEGTVMSGAYENVCKSKNIEYVIPSEKNQKHLSSIIYNDIKQGKDCDLKKFNILTDELKKKNCHRIILGCTELSLINKKYNLGEYFIDSMDVLAACTICACGKKICNFPPELTEFAYSLFPV